MPSTGAKSKTLIWYIQDVETVNFCHPDFHLEGGRFQAKTPAHIYT